MIISQNLKTAAALNASHSDVIDHAYTSNYWQCAHQHYLREVW